MSSAAHVDSLEPLKSLKSGLALFREGARDSSRTAQSLTQQALQEVGDHLRLWEIREQLSREDLEAAGRELSVCKASGYRDQDGRYHEPPCTAQVQRVGVAGARHRKTVENVQLIRLWRRLIEVASENHRRAAVPLDRFLESDVAKAEAFLGAKLGSLAVYQALGALAVGVLGIARSGQGLGVGSPGATGAVAAQSSNSGAAPTAQDRAGALPGRGEGTASFAVSPDGRRLVIDLNKLDLGSAELQTTLDDLAARAGVSDTMQEVVLADLSAATASCYCKHEGGAWRLADERIDVSGMIGGRRPTLHPETEPGGVEHGQSWPGNESGFRPGGERGL